MLDATLITKHDKIDAQHSLFLGAMLNLSLTPYEYRHSAAEEVIALVAQHCEYEHGLMERDSYPSYCMHRSCHVRLLTKSRALLQNDLTDEWLATVGADIMNEFKDHVISQDIPLARWLSEFEETRPRVNS